MLSFLQIRNFTIVEALDLEFKGGFTAITGETGAGKSILVGALGLLIGNRADTDSIRAGADRAELTAEFLLDAESRAVAWLRDAELDDGSSCLLRRMISDNGRSRAWINGTAVTLAQLSELGDLLVEIHGQNEHIRLVNSEEQFRLLDGGGSHDAQLEGVSSCFQRWSDLSRERQALLQESPLDASDRDLLRYQADELERSLLQPEEFLELEAEHRLLAKGSEIIGALEFAGDELDSGDDNIGHRLSHLIDSLQAHASLNGDIADAVQLLREAAINCQEAAGSIGRAGSRMDLSPERLAEIEDQLSTQHDLARKHRCSPEHLARVLQDIQERLDRAATLDERLRQVEKDLALALDAYRDSARRLHEARVRRARQIATAVTDLLQRLGMEGGRFEFEVTPNAAARPRADGTDSLELKVSANPGTPPGSLRKVASGGELSRISLAIKVASKAHEPAHTQVFDEVDAGIGGDTANAVGALLRSLSVDGQALCVTHLAQVAVCADHQIRVSKTTGPEETRIDTTPLDEASRVDEIARMLGGRLSDQSRAHASELLATAAARHKTAKRGDNTNRGQSANRGHANRNTNRGQSKPGSE
jgi:DNA repair protein RecN (Recombination protein N)